MDLILILLSSVKEGGVGQRPDGQSGDDQAEDEKEKLAHLGLLPA